MIQQNAMRKVSRYVLYGVGTLLFLFVLVYALLQVPMVQNKVVDQLTASLSERLGADVSIGRVDIKFFKTASIQGIYIEDLNNDTLLYVETLDVGVDVFNLFRKEIHINRVFIGGAHTSLSRKEGDDAFNYQFLVDAFTSDAQADTTASTWDITLDKVELNDVDWVQHDEVEQKSSHMDIGHLHVYVDTLDLKDRRLALRQIGISESSGRFRNWAPFDAEVRGEDTIQTMINPLSFPGTSWDIHLRQFRLEESQFFYDVIHAPGIDGHLDFNHLALDQVFVFIDELSWSSSQVDAILKEASWVDKSGFEVKDLTATLHMNPEMIHVNDFSIVTPKSRLESSTALDFGKFDDLTSFDDSVYITAYFYDSEVSLVDINYLFPSLDDQDILNNNLSETLRIDGGLKGTISNLQLNDLTIQVPNQLDIYAYGELDGLASGDPSFDIHLSRFNTSYAALQKLTKNVRLPQGIAPWGAFKLSGFFRGSIDDLNIRQVSLTTSGITGFEGDVHAVGLPSFSTADFDLDVKALRSVAGELDGFVNGGMPAEVDSLGVFFFRGNFKGSIDDFKVNGDFVSEAGDISSNFEVKFEEDFSNAVYSGDVSTDSFDLGRVLAQDNVGFLSMDVYSYGQGLDEHTLKTVVMGEVQHLDLQGYAYEGLNLDGRFDKKQFSGHAAIEDENIDVDFEGVISLSDTLSKFRFKTRIDTINFKALHLLDTELGMKARIRSDFRGSSFYEMDGAITATNVKFSNLEDVFKVDTIYLSSTALDQKNRNIDVTSDFVNGFIKGDFSLVQIPAALRDYVNNYFPVENTLDSVDTQMDLSRSSSDSSLADQDFEFELSVVGAQPGLSLVAQDLERLDSLILSGHVNTKDKELSLSGYLGKIVYGSMATGPITYSAQGDPERLDNVLQVNHTALPGEVDFPYLYLDALLENDSAYFSLLLEGDTDTLSEKLGLAALLVKDNDQFKATLHQILTLNGVQWQVNPDNQIVFDDHELDITDLDVARGDQKITIYTEDRQEPKDDNPIGIRFDDFRVSEISDFLGAREATYDGGLNGEVLLQDLVNNSSYLADLRLDDLTFQGEQVGNLTITSKQQTDQVIDMMLKLEGGISGVDFRGTYNTETSAIDLQGEVDRLSLKNVDPFLKKYIGESEGKISGLIDIKGTTSLPQINGRIELDKISTVIDYLQGRYTLENEDVEIRQNEILFERFSIKDPESNEAYIDGKVRINSFEEYTLDLDVHTKKFVVLNTSLRDNDLFYGKLVVRADMDIAGTAAEPVLDMNVRTLTGTDFHIQPLSYESSLQLEDFIIFANPEAYTADTTVSIQDLYKLSEYGMKLSANLELTPSAKLTIVVDPVKGDKLVCRGNANLAVDVTPQGDLNILGNYAITEGQYAFNFQRVLKRTFDIDPGSTVSFVGDPLKSRFNITANYGVNTTTYELIRNQSSLSAAEESQSKQRKEVVVKLKLNGNLEDPEASFDIVIPDQGGAGLTSSVTSKLLQLREDESSMNKQVFGLLIFSSFIAEEQHVGAASLIADAGQSAILTSVSNLLSNELNRLAKRYIKGVDLDFGVGSYSTAFGDHNSLITELQVGLSKSLLDDRLQVKLGGNVQFDNNADQDISSNQNSTFSGDFVLEYKLTADGNYRLRFFQSLSNEENLFDPGVNYSETGVSVFFTRSFNSKKYQLQIEEGAQTK